jgi:hypothetical protein
VENTVGNRGSIYLVALAATALPSVSAKAGISEDRVLILVNNASATSKNVASKYRQYHPGIPAQNVVYLEGLPPIATSADEIITRANFETYIAQPVRQHLLSHGLVDHIWVIVTTAGMPYRISDTTYSNVVYPHRSDAAPVVDHPEQIDAASVESELAVLWQIDPALDPNHRAPVAGRIVNPYHGYVSPFSSFCGDRGILARRATFHFAPAPADPSRVYEGQEFSLYRATGGRQFSTKDIYLVARLDGPRKATVSPEMFVLRMLELAARVSNPSHTGFHGYDPAWTAVIIDDKESGTVTDSNKWYNTGSAIAPDAPPAAYLTSESYPSPPNVSSSGIYRDDFRYAYRSLIGQTDLPDPNAGMVVDLMGPGLIGGPVVYDPGDTLLSCELDPNYGVGALCTFGVHQRSDVPPTYLLDGGPGGTPLFHPVYGAIFNSSESFSAVTFFTDADIPPAAQQALIWQWIYIQGSGAVGHAFEPLDTSVADNDLLFYNYFRDSDGDYVAEMTFVESAYSAMPYLSWATVVVGDPLMRLHRVDNVGPGWWDGTTCGAGVPLALMMVMMGLGGLRFARSSYITTIKAIS